MATDTYTYNKFLEILYDELVKRCADQARVYAIQAKESPSIAFATPASFKKVFPFAFDAKQKFIRAFFQDFASKKLCSIDIFEHVLVESEFAFEIAKQYAANMDDWWIKTSQKFGGIPEMKKLVKNKEFYFAYLFFAVVMPFIVLYVYGKSLALLAIDMGTEYTIEKGASADYLQDFVKATDSIFLLNVNQAFIKEMFQDKKEVIVPTFEEYLRYVALIVT